MNRATFFKSLFFGAAAAPAIARVLAEEPVKVVHCYSPSDLDLRVDYSAMHREIAKHIAEHSPYAGLVFALGDKPLRFEP
jgi:hypothetical protein